MDLRYSSVDLLGNMLQEEWLAKMKLCGQTERVWAALSDAKGNGADDVSDNAGNFQDGC